MKQTITAFCLAVSLFLCPAYAKNTDRLDTAISACADYLYKSAPRPHTREVGGEWTVIALSRLGYTLPAGYAADYVSALEAALAASGGVLHTRKYTEYSRAILALSALGLDPRTALEQDLTLPLGDFEKTTAQGVLGSVFALLALDSGGYEVPKNPDARVQAARGRYLRNILERQLSDGGFALSGNSADPDVTAMALQALSKYSGDSAVQAAIERGLLCLSGMQDKTGGFPAPRGNGCESTAQCLIALGELGIPQNDPRFVKGGTTLLDHLLTFQRPDGGFSHDASGNNANQMASEQALCALVSVKRFALGGESLYQMSPLRSKLFSDLAGHDSEHAVEALALRGLVSGKGDGTFAPNEPLTRAEFCAMLTRALGLSPRAGQHFSDVPADAWYADFVSAAAASGIVSGTSQGRFSPLLAVTRQEACVMLSRAARVPSAVPAQNSSKESLSRFSDAAILPAWASDGILFCLEAGILKIGGSLLSPQVRVGRGDAAEMFYALLQKFSENNGQARTGHTENGGRAA